MSILERRSDALEEKIAELGPWFHNLHLPGGVQTAPDHPLGDFPRYKWEVVSELIPEDLTGWTALDIGCNAGYYTFQLATRGANVTGIDVDPHYLRQAEWVAEQLGMADRVEFHRMQVYDLARWDRQFDLVLFMGVFYHLRYPLLGLDLVTEKVRRRMVFQTLTMPGKEVLEDTQGLGLNERDRMQEPGWPKMAFLEHRFANDPTNWWAPNQACVEAMLRSCGMKVLSTPGHEITLCEPDPDRPSCVRTWNADELLAATGRGPGGR